MSTPCFLEGYPLLSSPECPNHSAEDKIAAPGGAAYKRRRSVNLSWHITIISRLEPNALPLFCQKSAIYLPLIYVTFQPQGECQFIDGIGLDPIILPLTQVKFGVYVVIECLSILHVTLLYKLALELAQP